MLLAERRDDLVPDLLERDAQRFEHTRRDALALTHQTEEQVLGADVAVPELSRFIDRELNHLLRPRGERDLAR